MNISDWLRVQRVQGQHFDVDFDLEVNPLYIKTENLARKEGFHVQFLAASGAHAGRIEIYLTLAPYYALSNCASNTDFGSDVSNAISELIGASVIWTVKKTPGLGGEGPRIDIKLNEKLIVEFKISRTSCGNNGYYFWANKVRKVQFLSWDTASDFYKPPPKKCDGFKTGWAKMETVPEFPVDKGTTLTVSCTGSYELVGDSEITCNGNDEFLHESAREPRCGE